MKRILMAVILFTGCYTTVFAQPSDWQEVEQIFGRKGTVQGEMLKVTFPRSDLSVKIEGIKIDPGLALTTWIGFEKTGNSVLMMGDMVLLQKEVTPVLSKLTTSGVQVTALHNHLIGTEPSVMYLHFSGAGEPKKLAEAMNSALSLTGTPVGTLESPVSPAKTDWSKVETILGKTGAKKENLLQVGFPRKESIKENGVDVPPFLGVATGMNLEMLDDKRAAATGDFVLLADEVNPVAKALTESGIAVTAVHSHMLHESPRLFFLHFWGVAEPEKIARGLKSALDKTNSVR